MLGDKIYYICKKCGWKTSIRAEWEDLKPKRCMNKKCNTNFLAESDSLQIKRPEKKEKKSVEKVSKPLKKKRVYRKKK